MRNSIILTNLNFSFQNYNYDGYIVIGELMRERAHNARERERKANEREKEEGCKDFTDLFNKKLIRIF